MATVKYASGARKPKGQMNRTEKRFFESFIAPMLNDGTAVASWYEAWAFTLTQTTPEGKPGIRYTPDFVVQLAGGELRVYEVKGCGNARRESLNRTKLFASSFPLRTFLATQQAKKHGGGFKLEEY